MKKKFAIWTGAVGLLGLGAFLGHRRQRQQELAESALVAQVRAYFALMGTIDVVYVTEVNSRADQARGGVVFDDGLIFEFLYNKGDIDYRLLEEESHATS